MRKLLFILLLFPFVAMGQTATPIVMGSKYYEFKNAIRPDSAFFVPRKDTGTTDATLLAPGMLVYRTLDSLLYWRKGNKMTPIASGIGSLSDYVKYTDTAAMLANYIRTLNGLTGHDLSLATGTAGTDFNITTAGNTITLNLPSASGAARGVVTTATQTFAGAKTFSANVTLSSIPALGTAATLFLVPNSGVVSSRTPSQVLSDIGGAPSSGSGNYIQNQSALAQPSSSFWLSSSGRAAAFRTIQGAGVAAYQLGTTGDVIQWGLGFQTANNDFRLWSYNNAGSLQDSVLGASRTTSHVWIKQRLSVGTVTDDATNTLQVNGTQTLSNTAYSSGGIAILGRNITSGRLETGTAANFGLNLQTITTVGNSSSNTIQVTGQAMTPVSGSGAEIAGGAAAYFYGYNRTGGVVIPAKISHTGGDTHINEGSGSVGIGNTSPGAKLDVTGASSSTGSALRVRNSTPAVVFQADNNGEITLFGGVKIITGSGDPNGVKTAPAGSFYLNTGGGAAQTLWVKESGAGNTGWIAK